MSHPVHSSKKAPAGCLIPFGLLFLGAGLAVCWLAWSKFLAPARAVRAWTATPCQVTHWEVGVEPGGDVYKVIPRVAFDYEFNGLRLTGHTYDAALASTPSLNEFEEEGAAVRRGQVVCYVNPAHPEESSFRRGSYTSGGFVLGMGAVFAVTGGLLVLLGLRSLFRRITGLGSGEVAGGLSKGCAGGFLAPVFFALFAGGGFAVWKLALHDQPDWKSIGARMVPVPAKVLASGVSTSSSSRGTGRNNSTTYKAKVAFSYEFDGRTWHSGWLNFDRATTSSSNHGKAQDAANRYPVDARPTAWVDPDAPWRAVLEKDAGNRWWLWIFPIVFGGIGLVGLLAWLLKVTALGAALFGTRGTVR